MLDYGQQQSSGKPSVSQLAGGLFNLALLSLRARLPQHLSRAFLKGNASTFKQTALRIRVRESCVF